MTLVIIRLVREFRTRIFEEFVDTEARGLIFTFLCAVSRYTARAAVSRPVRGGPGR